MGLRHHLAPTWRSLKRAPLFSASVIVSLTVGIGSAAAIFAIVNAVLIRPLPYGHPDRLVGAWMDLKPINLMHAQQTAGTYYTFKRFVRSIEGMGIYQDGSMNVTDPNGQVEPQRMTVAWSTAGTLPLLEVKPILGRLFTDEEDGPKAPPVALISESVWRTRYASDPQVIGKTFVAAGKKTEIIGVMPSTFRFPNAGIQLWMPLQLDPNDQYPGGFNYNSIVRLKPSVTLDAAQREFVNVLPRFPEVSPNLAPGVPTQMVMDQAKPVPHLIPLRDDVIGDVSRTLWMIAAAAVLVLLVTCANVANLLLVRADGRHRELSVRAALGAGQQRVLAYFFTESALLTVVSAALALVVATVGIRLLVRVGPVGIPRLAEVQVDGAVYMFTVIVAVLVCLACSAIPAIRFLRGDPLTGLRDGGRAGTIGAHRQRARGLLVGAQMAFALLVLAASGLLLRSFDRLRHVKPGFTSEGIVTLWLTVPSDRYKTDSSVVRFYARLTERVAQLPGVRAVGLTSRVPLGGNGMNANPMFVEGDASSSTKIPPLEIYATVDNGYFSAMGIPLIAGRGFDPIDRQHPDEAIISRETAIALFHDSTGKAALNKRFRELPSSPWHTIVGVTGSVRDTSLSNLPTRMAYLPETVQGDTVNNQLRNTLAIVARTSGDVTTTTRAIQRLVRDVDPTLATFQARSMQDLMSESISRLTFTMVILGVAAAVTLLLAVVGLYGVIAYVVTLRTRELGVRIALGAQPRAVALMVTGQGLLLCGGGIVAGLGLVLVSGRFIRGFLYEIAPTDTMTLGASIALLVVFALLASWIPARRAARVNPIEALRSD